MISSTVSRTGLFAVVLADSEIGSRSGRYKTGWVPVEMPKSQVKFWEKVWSHCSIARCGWCPAWVNVAMF